MRHRHFFPCDEGPPALTGSADISAAIRLAAMEGMQGMSGACGLAAFAIHQAVFGGDARIVAAFNRAFHDRGVSIGHIAVEVPDTDDSSKCVYWDIDAKPKSWEEIEAWGMLDASDKALRADAKRLGFKLDDTAAETVVRVDFPEGLEQEVLDVFDVPLHRAITEIGDLCRVVDAVIKGHGLCAARGLPKP